MRVTSLPGTPTPCSPAAQAKVATLTPAGEPVPSTPDVIRNVVGLPRRGCSGQVDPPASGFDGSQARMASDV